MMKSTRIVAFASLAFTLAACGGRSGLNLTKNGEFATDDGGNPLSISEGGINDGKKILDGRPLDTSDGRLDGQRDSQVEVRRDTADTHPIKIDGFGKIDGPRNTKADLRRIVITPDQPTFQRGLNIAFKAIGTYDDSSSFDITGQAAWSSSDEKILSVLTHGNNRGLATALAAGTVTLSASVNSVTGSTKVTVTAPTLTAIKISPSNPTIGVKENQGFQARGSYLDGTDADLTASVVWSSMNLGVAANILGKRGVFTGFAEGKTTIVAEFNGVKGSTELTVAEPVTKPEGITALIISPSSATLHAGTMKEFSATAINSDGSSSDVTWEPQTTWKSSNLAVLSVGSNNFTAGDAIAISAGTATITISYFGLSASAAVTVLGGRNPIGLAIIPTQASILVEEQTQFRAILRYDDGSSESLNSDIFWSTVNPAVAVIDSDGFASGLGVGTTAVSATYEQFNATATLTVRVPQPKSLVVTPGTAQLQIGQTQNFLAKVIYDDDSSKYVTYDATWNTSDSTVAFVYLDWDWNTDLELAKTTALKAGSATIKATYAGLSATATLTVTDRPLLMIQITPIKPVLILEAPFTNLVATAIFDDYSTRNVTQETFWTSSSSTVAVISNVDPLYPDGSAAGQVNALSVGATTITALYFGKTASTSLTVAAKKVTTLQVTPINPKAMIGVPQAMVATAIFDDQSTANVTRFVSWTSSDPTVAVLDDASDTSGVVTPLNAGTATIRATLQGISGTAHLTVNGSALQSITITPSPLSLKNGTQKQLIATGTYADGSTHNITESATWISSNSGIVFVSNATSSRGLATALGNGAATLEAHFQGITGTLPVTVDTSIILLLLP